MEDKFKGLSYGEVLDLLPNCKNLDDEIEIYKKLVELGEKEIAELKDEEDLLVLPTGEAAFCVPDFLDHYAAPMDNLSQIYVRRKEYAKAALILERALILYRMQEEFLDPDFVWQRYYTLNGLVQCYTALGNKTWAIIHEYEKRLLETKYEKLVLG